MTITDTDRLHDTLAVLKPRRIENDMQDAIATALTRDGFNFTKEHRHDGKNRLDFLVQAGDDRVVIEVKVAGASGPDTERQLLRYAALGICDRIFVVTTIALRLRISSIEVAGRSVPVRVINLAMNAIA